MNNGAGISVTHKDYGAYGNTYSLRFYPGSTQGILAVVEGTDKDGNPYYYKIDNEPSLSNLVARLNRESAIDVGITAGGNKASQTIQIATSQVDGRATLMDAQGVTRGAAYLYQYPVSVMPNGRSLLASWNGVTQFAISALDDSTDVFTATGHTLVDGNLVKFSGTVLPTGMSADKRYYIRNVSSHTFKISERLDSPASFVVSGLVEGSGTFTSPGHALAVGDVVELTGSDRTYFVNYVNGDTFRLSATATGVALTAFTNPIASNLAVTKVGGDALDIDGDIEDGAVHLLLDTGVSISGSVPTEFNAIYNDAITYGRSAVTITTASVTATAYASDTARITLNGGQTFGYSTGKGLIGSIFTIASGAHQGVYQILHHEFDGLSSDRVRVIRKLTGNRSIALGTWENASIEYYPAIALSKIQPSKVIETVLPGNGLLPTGGQYLTLVIGDSSVAYATEPGDTISYVLGELATLVNSSPEINANVTASASYNPATYTGTLTLTATSAGVVPNGYRVAALVNTNTALLFTADGALLEGGTDPNPPQNAQGVTSGVIYLSGGYDSAPTYQRWLDGLEAAAELPIRWLVPAGTDNIGVQAAFVDHCELMSSTPKRRERMCVLGHGLGWTPTQVRARGEFFQSERAIFVSPGMVTNDDKTGLLKTYASYYTAAVIAGMLSAEGNGISDPITHSYLKNISGLEINYKPGSLELDSMLESGVLTIERDPALTRPSRGYRVCRALTTWRISSNAGNKSNAFESISVINQSDYIAAVIRDMEEQLFIGKGIFPETLEQIRLAVNRELLRRTTEKIIYGYDPKFTRVSLNPSNRNAVDVQYRIYPAPALEFILNTQLLAPIPESEVSTNLA